jgi:hypothetical protein
MFHFGFELFKIALLAAIYSYIILSLKYVMTALTGNNQLRLIKFKALYLTIAGLMFVFSFTYYGDHGLGDEASLPLGHGIAMNSSDGYPFLYLEPNNQINIDSFLVRNNHLCFTSKNNYYDYQLASGKWDRYNSKEEYETYASAHNLPRVKELKTFYPQYAAYWNGWRFWLLP